MTGDPSTPMFNQSAAYSRPCLPLLCLCGLRVNLWTSRVGARPRLPTDTPNILSNSHRWCTFIVLQLCTLPFQRHLLFTTTAECINKILIIVMAIYYISIEYSMHSQYIFLVRCRIMRKNYYCLKASSAKQRISKYLIPNGRRENKMN